MKTIVFVIESLHCGGAEKSIVTLLQNINYSEYQVDLILIKKGGEFEKFVPKEVNIIYKNIFSKNPLIHFISRFRFWWLKKLRKNKAYNTAHTFWTAYNKSIPNHQKKYDVAIGYSQGFATYYVAEKVKANIKYAWLNIDYEHAKHYAGFDYQYYVQLNSVVCVSPECKTSLLKEMETIGKTLHTTILKDITDDSIVNKLSNESTGFSKNGNACNILTVCRLAKQKGLHLAVNACVILKNKGIDFKWYIIGEGSERSFLENEIQNKDLESYCILLGFKENPYPFMKTCDIYVQTSLFEGLGLTVIEAAILHKPIVTTNFPTASSIITHNKTGLICEMTPKAIAASVSKYIEDKMFRDTVVYNLSKVSNTDKETSLATFYSLIN
jgi:glycosyltransferase involved in cell wall biosynthesis